LRTHLRSQTHFVVDRGLGVPLPLPVLLVIGTVAAAVVGQGGYYPPVRTLVTALAGTALLAALWVRPWTRDEAWLLVACGALAGWAVVRAAMDGSVTAAVPTVATLGCVVSVLTVLRRADTAQREICATIATGVGAAVALSGWIGVAWRIQPLASAADDRLWRASSTLTYANAAAALLGALSVLSIALLLARPASLLRATTAYLLMVGLGATLSRAGLLSALVGLVVLGLLAGVRSAARTVAPVALGAAIAVGGLVPSVPVVAQPRPLVAVLAMATGLAIALGGTRLPRRIRPIAVLGATVAAGVLLAMLVLPSRGMDVLTGSRATLTSPTRTDSAKAAWRLVADHPLLGVGPGRAAFTWALPDGRIATGRYAHNEYLQILVEFGALGFVLLLGVLVAIVVTVRRGRPVASSPLLWAGATAALAAVFVHSGLDFLWQLPVVPLTGALLAGLAGPAIPPSSALPAVMEDQ